MELIIIISRSCAPFEIADIRIFFCDDQVLSNCPTLLVINPKISRKFDRAAHPFRNIDKRAIGKDSGIERCKIIVPDRNDAAQIFFDQLRIKMNRLRNRSRGQHPLLSTSFETSFLKKPNQRRHRQRHSSAASVHPEGSRAAQRF